MIAVNRGPKIDRAFSPKGTPQVHYPCRGIDRPTRTTRRARRPRWTSLRPRPRPSGPSCPRSAACPELAFDKEGNPFRFSRLTRKLRPRRWKNPGKRGTCAAVLDADGEQVLIDADAEYIEFRAAVGNVPGFYRLDQCDEDGNPIEDAPPAYVSIDSTRNAAPAGEVDPRDAIIRDLAQINADVTRTIAERFSNVMQAAAEILRAADGAGLPRREPPPPTPDEDEDDDQEDEDDDQEPLPSEKVWEFVEQMLPTIGMWLTSLAAKRSSTPPPAATPPSAPAPAVAPAPAAAPSAAPAPGGVAAGQSTPEPAGAPESAGAPAPVAASSAATPAPASATASSSTPPVVAASGSQMGDGAAPSTTAIAGGASAAQVGTAPVDGPRNAALPVEPTPEQWSHLLAIRARLSPREAAIAESVVVRMSPEMRAQWLAELSALSVDQAADIVRSMVPKPPRKASPARNDAKNDGKPHHKEKES